MNVKSLKEKIVQANASYRSGSPIMSDQEFDDLCDEYQKLVSKDEWNEFRDSLHEKAGKVKHSFIMGSLDKIKYEEPKAVKQFIDNYCPRLIASAKVDGISCRLHYEDGRLVSASTRGNGEFGEDITDKIKYVKCIPEILGTGKFGDEYKSIDIRGELVILKNDFAAMTGFANARNACAGIMNRKDWNKDDVSKITFVAYTILGDKFTKEAQFAYLSSWGGFCVAWNKLFMISELRNKSAEEIADMLFNFASQDFEYETDGLVLCDATYKNEAKYRPDECKAFKINQLIAETTVEDVVFSGPSKDGTHCPLAVLSPVELGGAMISRATLHNLDIISELGIKYGSKVKLLRSGDVIPKIIEVISSPAGAKDIVLPKVCNCCHQPLVQDGVNLRCINKKCRDQLIQQIYLFICKLGVKSTAAKSLDNLGIDTFDKLIAFRPKAGSKTQEKLYSELATKVFTRTKGELLNALNFVGLSETLISKIVDFYGWENIEKQQFSGYPNGVGEITLQKFKDSIVENLSIVNKLMHDSRYNCSRSSQSSSKTSAAKNGMSVCFTGKLNTMSRSEAEKKAQEAGYEIKSVNKHLTYLVTNDTTTGSSKNRKAKELGIKVISEKEFLKLIEDNTVESSLEDL